MTRTIAALSASGHPTSSDLRPRRLASNLIAGKTVDATGGRARAVSDPTTGRPGGELVAATDGDVAAAVDAAQGACRSWRRTPPAARAALLRDAARSVHENAADLGAMLCATTGRLLREATASAHVAADLLDEAAVTGLSHAGRALAGDPSATDLVRREPRGVVAVLTPWNDPYPTAAGLIAAALVTGNTVVHKPSERSAMPGWELGRRIAAHFPDGVLNVINGDGDSGSRLVADPRVDLVAHVGSTATGRRIAAAVGERGGRVVLENGGNDPLIVDAGTDPVWAAAQIALGAFANAGQLCTSVERIYLHESVADAVLTELVRQASGLVIGDPRDPSTDMGPLVDERQLSVVDAHVRQAVEAGADCLTGGQRLSEPGCFYAPTVLADCTDDMDVMAEETFGPVAPVSRAASFEEAVRRAGSGRYGLSATVLTPRVDHALSAAESLDVGTVKVNAVFGGAPGGSADPRRGSGSGRGYGPDLLDEMTALKVLHVSAGHRE